MSGNNMDDLIPRPLPKPSQMEEICAKPQVPEVSLVFDSVSCNSDKISSPLIQHSSSISPHAGSLLNTNYLIPRLEHHYSSLSSPKSPNPSSLTNVASKTPLKLDDRGVLAAKKVSFSPIGPITGTNVSDSNGTESQHQNENPTCHCSHDAHTGSQHNHNFKSTPDEKKAYLCSSYSNENFDYSWDHSTSIQRILKNMERKMNTKVTYDDLQKTELKIENILLKHKCKYDKLGENCVTKDEFNRIIKNYETQISLLQLRVEELAQKLSFPSHFVGPSYNHEIKKCNCTDDFVHMKSPPKQIVSAVKYLNHNCCPSHPIPNGNYRENDKNSVNVDAAVSTNNHDQFNVQSARSNQDLQQLKNCYQNCCRVQDNFKNIDHCDAIRLQNKNVAMENQIMIQTANSHSSPDQYNHTPVAVHKSNTNQLANHQPQHHSNQLQNFSRDHHLPLNERNGDQVLSTEKNIRLDWAFYNNIVEDVKNLMQNNSKPPDSNAETIELIKKATVEQLHKMGINLDNRVHNERNSPIDHQNDKFIPTNPAASPDLSFHVNSVAMKYVSETKPDDEHRKTSSASDYKKPPANDISFRSNCNNVSIATLQYMERYQLLPNCEQRYGGSATGFNRYEQNVAQEHHHRTYKPSQYNDRNNDRGNL